MGRKPESKKLPDPVFRGESNGICENILRIEFRRNPKIQNFRNSAPEFLKIGFLKIVGGCIKSFGPLCRYFVHYRVYFDIKISICGSRSSNPSYKFMKRSVFDRFVTDFVFDFLFGHLLGTNWFRAQEQKRNCLIYIYTHMGTVFYSRV